MDIIDVIANSEIGRGIISSALGGAVDTMAGPFDELIKQGTDPDSALKTVLSKQFGIGGKGVNERDVKDMQDLKRGKDKNNAETIYNAMMPSQKELFIRNALKSAANATEAAGNIAKLYGEKNAMQEQAFKRAVNPFTHSNNMLDMLRDYAAAKHMFSGNALNTAASTIGKTIKNVTNDITSEKEKARTYATLAAEQALNGSSIDATRRMQDKYKQKFEEE